MNHNSLTGGLAKGLRLLFAAALVAGLALSAGPVRIAHTATLAEYTVAQQAVQCPNNAQSCFGDTNTTYGGDGSVDDFRSGQYSSPPAFVTWARNATAGVTPGGGELRNSDSIGLNEGISNVKFPFVLRGHPRFNPDRVMSATLRVDFQWPIISSPGSDTIQFWDEQDTSGAYFAGFQYGSRLHRKLTCKGTCLPD